MSKKDPVIFETVRKAARAAVDFGLSDFKIKSRGRGKGATLEIKGKVLTLEDWFQILDR